MDPVQDLLTELQADPTAFEEKEGYERLMELLWKGHSPKALKDVLRGDAAFIRDLLWCVRSSKMSNHSWTRPLVI